MLELYKIGVNASPDYLKDKTFEKVVEEVMIAIFVPMFLIWIIK